jgi:nucleotide-binding universal stress UspA family protein
MLKRILVATDFSRSADVAWHFAVDLASAQGAELILLHVAMPPPSGAPHAALRDHQRNIANAQRQVAERVGRATSRRVTPSGLVATGEPVSVIVTTATANGADLIVVDSHRLADPTAVLVGSAAERLVRAASCAVLVIKTSDSEAA